MAQNLHFKIGGGLSTLYGADTHCVGAFKVGLGYEVELDSHWAFTPGIEVYAKGFKNPDSEVFVYDKDGSQMFDPETGEPLVGLMNRTTTQNYIEVPLLFSYYLRTGESRYVVMSAGPYLAYGVSGKQKTKGDTRETDSKRYYYEHKTFGLPGVHRLDGGVQTFVGYQFPSGVTLGVEADFGILKFNRDGKRNLSGILTLGYKL